MSLAIDLHIHSQKSSDGEFLPAEIIEQCIEHKVHTFAITDHNSVRSTQETIDLAQQAGLDFRPGIEVDCNFRGTNLHLLGYQINWASPDFLRLEEGIAAQVMASFGEMVDNLTRLGFRVDADAVLTRANGKLPTGELIAEVMLSDARYSAPPLIPYMEGGARSDMPQINFYLDYFAQGKPAFVPLAYMDYGQAVALIRDNGGVPIVAHPGLNLKGHERVVEQLLDHGAAGLEVFNNYHTSEQSSYFATEIEQRNGMMTCGSDFHGSTKPLIQIGQFRFDSRYEPLLVRSVQQLQGAIR